MLALATNDGLVRLVESRSGEERMRFRARSSRGAHCVALSRDGMKLALGNENLRILNVQNGEELARMEYRVTALTFSPCGTRVAAGGYRAIILHDVGDVEQQLRLDSVASWVTDLAWAQDGLRLASLEDDGARLTCWENVWPQWRTRVLVWDTRSGHILNIVNEAHARARLFCIAFAPGRPLLAGGGNDKATMVWDLGLDSTKGGRLIQLLHNRYQVMSSHVLRLLLNRK
jgi:WD40 repeat protein